MSAYNPWPALLEDNAVWHEAFLRAKRMGESTRSARVFAARAVNALREQRAAVEVA